MVVYHKAGTDGYCSLRQNISYAQTATNSQPGWSAGSRQHCGDLKSVPRLAGN